MKLPVIPPQVRLALIIAPWLIAAALLAALLVTRATLETRKVQLEARYEKLTGDVTRATAAAAAIDQANARRVETAQDNATQETARDLEGQLARARADAAAYARRLRDAAAQGRGGAACVPGAPEPARPAAGPGGAAQLDDDLRICAEAVTKAQGWQDWWGRVEAVPR